MTTQNGEFLTVLDVVPTRISMIMDESLSGFHLANAIAVIAMTAGKRHPILLGQDLVDADGIHHPGLIPSGIPMLTASQKVIHSIRDSAIEKGLDVVDFTEEGQMTKNYDEYLDMMSRIRSEDLHYLGIAVIGSKSAVSKLTKDCAMMR